MNGRHFVTAALLAEQSRLAHAIADRAVMADIESEAVFHPLPDDPRRWLDVRPLTSAHEHAGPVLDMAADALAYARFRGLIAYHPRHAHLVRITRQP